MNTYIALLRGINVSGQKIIKMDALRNALEQLGLQQVTTYLQSGNVIFKSNKIGADKLDRAISEKIEIDFGFEAPVMVLSVDTLCKVIDHNPFLQESDKELVFLHVTFLASKPDHYDRKTIEDKRQNGEEIVFSDRAIYLYCPNGYGRTKLTNNFLEKKLKVSATTRNWKTTNEIFKMAQQIEKL